MVATSQNSNAVMHNLNALPALCHNLTSILQLRNRSAVFTTYCHLNTKSRFTADWLSYMSWMDSHFSEPILIFRCLCDLNILHQRDALGDLPFKFDALEAVFSDDLTSSYNTVSRQQLGRHN